MQAQSQLQHLTDDALVAATHQVNGNCQRATAELLAHLGEIDRCQVVSVESKVVDVSVCG